MSDIISQTQTAAKPPTADALLLEQLDASTMRHRAEVQEIVDALAKLGERAGIPPSDNMALYLASEYARKLDRLDEFDLDALDDADGDDEDGDDEEASS
jgi:hypothetical protein